MADDSLPWPRNFVRNSARDDPQKLLRTFIQISIEL